jgi:hypothetical protein
MMAMISSRFRASRPPEPRTLPHPLALIRAEYQRAIRAARYYDSLKNLSRAEPRRQQIGAGGAPRAVFEALYSE